MHTSLKAVIFSLVIVSCAWPQASTGTVSGTVRDQSRAVISNTEVVLLNTATNARSTTRTNEAGFYMFPAVIVGPYRLTVEVPGMQKYEGTFIMEATQDVAIDPALHVASSTATVQVTADLTATIAADDGMLRDGVDQERIEQLPQSSRNLLTLMQTLPGVESSNGSRAFGLPQQSMEFIQDGSAETDRRYNMSFYSKYPAQDSIEEFTLNTNAVTAQYTRPASVIISTKSGTNEFHGGAFEYHQDADLGWARTRTQTNVEPAHNLSNSFGVTVGGPLVIPKLYNGKNRTFWFFDGEFPRARSATQEEYYVPTTAMDNGDFSGLLNSSNQLQVLYDPWSTGPAPNYQRTPFPNNQIPVSRESPTAKYLLGITPAPNMPANNPLITENYWGYQTNASNVLMAVARFDQRFSDRDLIYVRLSRLQEPHTQYDNTGTVGLEALNGVAGYEYVLDGEENFSAHWTHIASPTLFNEFLVSARYRRGGEDSGSGTHQPVNWFTQLGMPNPLGSNDWPQFTGMGLKSYALTSSGTTLGDETYDTVDDNVTKIHGKHEFLFGGHFRKDFINTLAGNNGQSSFTFSGLATADYSTTVSTPTNPAAVPNTGYALADMFMGVSQDSVSLYRKMYYLRSGDRALYFQDNFRVTPRLTLNLGVRWEFWPAVTEKHNTMTGFDEANHAIVLGTSLANLELLGLTTPSVVADYEAMGVKFETYQAAGLPQSLVYPNYKNFAPRLGFAYRVFGNRKPLVVRGGYSLTYFSMDYSWAGTIGGGAPFSATWSYNPNSATTSPNGLPNYGLISNPLYVDGVNDTNSINLSSSQPTPISPGASVSYFDPHMTTPRASGWNLTLERELGFSTVARVGYVGNHSSDLPEYFSYNNAPPTYIWYATTGEPLPTGSTSSMVSRPYDQTTYGTVQEWLPLGYSNNQAINLELERRYRKGYAYQLSYVVMNALGTGSGTTTVQTPNQYLPGAVPTDLSQMNTFLNYGRDTSLPKTHVRWNFVADVPVGKGKFLDPSGFLDKVGVAGRVLDKVIGGWMISGIGNLVTTYFTLPTTDYGFTGVPIQTYGYKYPIEDCLSTPCQPGYLWWNGYIPANEINSYAANGTPNGYEGIPSNYKPAVEPLIPYGSTTLPPNAPANLNISSYWNTDDVWIPLKNGTVQEVTENTNLHPWRNQYLPGVRQWTQDASIFKTIPINERIRMRFSADFFNVFNHPGNPNSVNSSGFQSDQASGESARTIKLGLRLNW
jgi:hypothetical protein